jgi:hypothetical protein
MVKNLSIYIKGQMTNSAIRIKKNREKFKLIFFYWYIIRWCLILGYYGGPKHFQKILFIEKLQVQLILLLLVTIIVFYNKYYYLLVKLKQYVILIVFFPAILTPVCYKINILWLSVVGRLLILSSRITNFHPLLAILLIPLMYNYYSLEWCIDLIFMMHFGRIILNSIILPIKFKTLENGLLHYKKTWLKDYWMYSHNSYKIMHPIIPFSILDFQYSAKIVRFKPIKKLFFIILKNIINKKNIIDQKEYIYIYIC